MQIRKLLLFLLSILCFTNVAQPQTSDWTKTRVLKRYRSITVESENKLVVEQREEIIIADEDHKYLGYDGVREADYRKLDRLDAVIYDVNGEVLRELKKDDIQESTISYESIYNEHKSIFHRLSYPTLPYRIVTSQKYELKSSFFWPDWDPQSSVPVDFAQLEIILKHPADFRYLNVGGIGEPEIFADDKGVQHYVWKINDIVPFEKEYLAAPEAEFQVGVKLQANQFDLGGYEGSAADWRNFGSWFQTLLDDRLNLPADPAFVLMGALTDPHERIRQLYRYLQTKTRYVQIYLGIDGWQPHYVADIHNNKYGDCKDLSVYMIAMLQQAGVQAYPALARPRYSGLVDPTLPGNQFNHVIAVVPMENDTLLLECTSDLAAFNDAPPSLEGVNLLLVTPDGSRLIKTPLSAPDDNRSKFTARAILKSDRSLSLEGTLTCTGNRAYYLRGSLAGLEPDKQRAWLIKQMSEGAGNIQVSSFTAHGLQNPDTTVTLQFSVNMDYFARKAGSRLFFQPAVFHKVEFDGEEPSVRTMALLNMTRYVEEDSIVFQVPNGLKLRGGARSDSLATSFGQFEAFLGNTGEGNELIWRSKFTLRAREVPLEDYSDYYDFMNSVKKMAGRKLALQKKT